MSTRWIDGSSVGGQMLKWGNTPASEPDMYAYTRLFQPTTTGSLALNAWRSQPIGGGVNGIGFTVRELRAAVRTNASAGTVVRPTIIKPGWSTVYLGQASGTTKQINCYFGIGYMQFPPGSWPTPSGAINLNTNQGFHFYDNPIGARIPSPNQYLTSLWTVVMVWDYPAFLTTAQVPDVYDFSMWIESDDIRGTGEAFAPMGPAQNW